MANNINFNEKTGQHSFFSNRYAKLYITVTGYYQNVKEYKEPEDKLNSVLFGTALQRSQTAFRICDTFSKHGDDALLMN